MNDKTLPDGADFEEIMHDQQEFAGNMHEVFEVSQKIWEKFLESNADKQPSTNTDPLNTMPAFTELTKVLLSDPQKLMESAQNYWAAQAQIWQHSMLKLMGDDQAAEAVAMPDLPAEGRRFKHDDWSQNAAFEYIKQSYLLASGWLQDTVHEADMAPKDRKKADFYARNFVEALNPANFAALNPEVLEATTEEKGQNLVRGLKMMLEDMERGKGKLLIRQTDMDAFEVGGNMAMTEGKVIWQSNIMQLIQYSPLTEEVYSKPLLMIPPWINKYYVLDLNKKKSMMKWLVEQGYTVFIISWVNPDEAQKDETWGSYMHGVSEAMDAVLIETDQKQVHLASYCIGGSLTATLTAALSRDGDKRIASATFFTALIDFEDAGELQVFVDDKTIAMVNEQMEQGYLPAQTMASAFNMLRSSDLIWSYVVSNYMLGKAPVPFDLLYWNADSTAMPAKVHHFYLDLFYTQNVLVKDQLTIDDKPVRLRDITLPVYHVAAKEDHIAPPASVYGGARHMRAADVRFVLAGSGHIAGVVNPPAAGKYQYWTNKDISPETMDAWLEGATETAGSWWVDWDKWLKRKSGKKVPARVAGAVGGVLQDAPGSFVKKRFDEN
ncbi:MAG: class I poly(R)-hydroxyalkanoic acid synthase [Paracoccaceae bacterium]|jgi:polyhydroxyalkanoate synthase